MPLAKLKIIIFSSVLFIFSAFIIIAVTINFYDQNSFLNTIENKIVTLYNRYSTKKTDAAHKKNITSTNKTVQALDNYYVINIENKISSELFLNLLYYLGDTSTDYVVIDANFSNLSDSLDLNETKKFIKTKDNFFGVIEIRNFKGLNIRPNRFLKKKKLLKNFLYLKKTKYPFIYSNYLGLIKIENQFFISPDKIGLISKKNMIFDQNNIDALYKFDNKFLFSLPSLIYIKNKEQDINNINFLFFSINYKNKKLYYDQKGRMSFKHNINKQKAPHVYNFTDWNEALQARINTIKKIKKLNLFKSQKKGFQLYKEEKKIINSIYNFPEIQDDKANTTLTIAKNEASLWKGFKTSNLDKIKQSKIFIVQNGNFAWVSDFIFQKNILNYGKNLKRIPLSFTILFSIILLFLIFLCVFFIKKNIVSFIICLTLALLNFSLYFIFRILLNIDIPFLTLLIIIIYGFLGGLLLRVFNYKIWIKEVKSIFKGSVSKKYAKEIANYWKNKKWSLESKAYLCTFVHIDTSTFLQKDITEDEVEVIGNKNSEIETIIKNNCGIRNNFNPAEILCYFGNPAIYKNHAQKAIKTAYSLNKIPITINSQNVNLRIAIHSKQEWFKYIKKDNQKCYTYFGNSINILSSMIQYAKKFNILIIISDTVYKLCSLKIPVRMLDRIRIPYINETIRLFELLTNTQYKEGYKFYDYFHAGLKLFEKQKWNEAAAYFRQCLKINDDDTPSKIYLKRCKDFANISPKKEWDGVYEIDH